MLSVRELKTLAASLDDQGLKKQLGPFVLVQRPWDASAGPGLASTRRLAPPKQRSALDFEDAWVATIPPMEEMDSFSIGRAPDCDVIIDHESVSKRHARIDWLSTYAELEDLGSSNGTFLNGQKVRGRSVLTDNDALDFGSVQVFFMLTLTLRRRMSIVR